MYEILERKDATAICEIIWEKCIVSRHNETVGIIKSGSLYIFGNLFNKAIAFITVPIFTRMLTTAEYGIVNTYSSWVSMLAVIIGLSMTNSVRNAFVDFRKELGEYISSVFSLATVNFAIILILSQLIAKKIPLSKTLLLLCLIESFSNFIVNTIVMKCVMEEAAGYRTLLMVLPNLIGAILSVVMILMLSTSKYYGRVIGTCIGTSLFGIPLLCYYCFRYKTLFSKKYWSYALSISLPLILHGLSTNILGTSDRTIITIFDGAEQTGVYSLIYNLCMVAGVITSSAESVWLPRFTRNMMNKDYGQVNREISILVYVVIFFFCGLFTIAPELVLLLGGQDYLSGMGMLFPLISASFVTFLYGIYVNCEYYYKKTATIATSTLIAAGLNVVLNFVFVPIFGAVAAAYTTLASYIVSFLLHSRKAHSINKEIAPYRIMVVPCLIIIVAGIITSVLRHSLMLRYATMTLLGIAYVFVGYIRNLKENEFHKK